MISFQFSLSFISSFLHSFHLSHQCKGVSRPVPSRNPSLHLDVWVCECVSVWVCDCSHSPVLLNLIPWIFIAFVLADIFPLLCILRWLASRFQVTGNRHCSPSQLEPCSHSTTQARVLAHRHTPCFCSPLCVWMASTFGCVALYLWRRILLSSVSARLLFFPCIIVSLPQVLLFVCRVLYSSCDAFKSHGTHKKH